MLAVSGEEEEDGTVRELELQPMESASECVAVTAGQRTGATPAATYTLVWNRSVTVTAVQRTGATPAATYTLVWNRSVTRSTELATWRCCGLESKRE